MGEQQPSRNQECKHTVDGRRVKQHGHPQFLGVGNHPFFVFVNGGLEFFEGKDGLPKGLDHRNAPHIFHRLAGHGGQRVAVLPHFFFHLLAGHGGHDGKGQNDGNQAQQPQPPVKHKQQHQQPHGGGHGTPLVWQLVGEVGFRRAGALLNNLAQPAAAIVLHEAQGQLCKVLHGSQPQIGGYPEGGQMGAQQGADVN